MEGQEQQLNQNNSRWSRQSRSGSIFTAAIDRQTNWDDLFTRMDSKQGSIEDFKKLMYKMQSKRREFVVEFLNSCNANNAGATSIKSLIQITIECIQLLSRTHEILYESENYQKEIISTNNEKLQLNVKDESHGLRKDLLFLEKLKTFLINEQEKSDSIVPNFKACLIELDFIGVLAPYHPISAQKFIEEHKQCVQFLRNYINANNLSSEKSDDIFNKRKPIMITDWDGTMKDYCSQYATNLQPIYSAISMAKFSKMYTRLTAVLTAGPLRGPGILDLTSLPKDGPIVFGGSWGRECWLNGKRIVHDEGISDEGLDALERLNSEMSEMLSKSQEFSHFALVGSGVQRKVDRLTLGVQTVCNHIDPDLSSKYQEQVKERLHRVDPNEEFLHFDPSTKLEVEVVIHNKGEKGVSWDKASGIKRLVETISDSLDSGSVLVCGDTHSDLPMVTYVSSHNKKGLMALFVTTKNDLQEKVVNIVGDSEMCCFVSSPDVIHAAMISILSTESEEALKSMFDGEDLFTISERNLINNIE